MTRKPDTTNSIDSLPPKQRAALEKWLLGENASMEEISSRFESRFKAKLPPPQLSRHQAKLVRERILNRITTSVTKAKAIQRKLEKNSEVVFEALTGMIGQAAFDRFMAGDDKNFKALRPLLVMLVSARKDARLERQFHFQREKWEFDVAQACQLHHSELSAIATNPAMSVDERLNAIRARLFGSELPA